MENLEKRKKTRKKKRANDIQIVIEETDSEDERQEIRDIAN